MPSNGKKKQKPEIELYLYSLNQEFPVQKGHSTFLKSSSDVYADRSGKFTGVKQVASQVFRTAADDWSVQWISNEWIQNYTYYPGAGLLREGDPLANAIARQEDFGGIVFDRISDRIYKANTPGFELFQDLQKAHAQGKLEEFRSRKFGQEEVGAFVAILKGAGLWPL